MAVLNNSNAISPSGYDINNSLRFRASASAYLNRTPASSGNQQKFTWSGWVKRGTLSSGYQTLFMGGNTANNSTLGIAFAPSDILQIQGYSQAYFLTTQVYRDPSAWYHFVIAIDTTQATSSNRVKLYVNGVEVTAGTRSDPALNTTFLVNTAVAHAIGNQSVAWGFNPFDGYMAEINFVDGQGLTPSSFGETNTTTGSWVAKKYTGTYGTNGFYLKFSDIATTSGSNAGLGKDFSGNTNYWTTNNISVTAGTTYDAMLDVPTNTSATVANYCVLNPLQTSSLATVTDANLTVKGNSATNSAASVATMQVPTGLYYAEFTVTGTNSEYPVIGVVNTDTLLSNSNLLLYGSPGYYSGVGYQANGQKRLVGGVSAYGSSFTTGDVIGIAVDTTNGAVYFAKNNTWQNSGVPTSGSSKTGAAYTYTAGSINLIMSIAPYNTSSGVNANFGQRPFAYTPPTGFVALNTYNLPDSTIKKGNSVMDATLYTGNGTSQTITNAGAFKPDFVWVKQRNGTNSNALFDAVRGVYKYLYSNATDAEVSDSSTLTSFNSNGFSTSSAANVNGNTNTYVGWQWQAGQGSSSSNTSGTITSTVSVNATAGFSVVTWAAQSTARTVGHGLGVAPSMIIMKDRSGAIQWFVYHASIGTGKYLTLNTTAASVTNATVFSTAPTSSVFDPGTGFTTGNGYGNQVAYCWAEIAGFSKFGSYTGNGSTDGPFVYTGFRPKYVMFKSSTSVASWWVFDTARNTYNAMNNMISPNQSAAEITPYPIDCLANGFKLRTIDGGTNGSGNTYIYMAFAEVPTKFANAR